MIRSVFSLGSKEMFLDQATIHVKGGRGGDGCVSFCRTRSNPRGGPDGGDGGRGGDVIVRAVAGLNTLRDIPNNTHYTAEKGKRGGGNGRNGRSGRDVLIDVPPGTLVRDAAKGVVLRDLVTPGEQLVVARGGAGGKGNRHFANAVNQAPRHATEGREGEERTIELELKLIADVGLIGLPNAGKSTLLARLSNAHPKIADYEFTTLEPQLGIMELWGYSTAVLADIPGLIEGAHSGAGLGDEFLRHIERTRVLAHLVDVGTPEPKIAPAKAYDVIRSELKSYSAALAVKPEIVVATKTDLTGADERFEELREALDVPVIPVSAVTGKGLEELRREFGRMLNPEQDQ